MLDEHFAELEGAREESTLILRNFYKSEEIFLDMFEDEWREMNKRPINVEYVMSDASLLLPPTGTKSIFSLSVKRFEVEIILASS